MKKLLKRIGGWFANPWVITALVALAVGLLLWFIVPLIAIGDVKLLQSETSRLVALLILTVIWALTNVFIGQSRRAANEALIQDLEAASAVDEAKAANEAASAEELQSIGERLRDALQLLKQSRFGKSGGLRLYQVPWYVLLGPPGSGKTTALSRSGLDFPLQERLGQLPVTGIGGTHNCDWWIADRAVFIDTAGRYTTHDSHKEVDQRVWHGLLDILKKHRPRQPLNGALIMLPLPELARMGEEERATVSKAIRFRLTEVQERLGTRLPVYMIFTKCDLIPGFIEFFSPLNKAKRAVPLGVSLPYDSGSGTDPVAGFGSAFDGLVDDIRRQVLRRLNQEPDIGSRSLVLEFPFQLASLRDTALEFLARTFGRNRLERPSLLRGFYFTSGTQSGDLADGLAGQLEQKFAIGAERRAEVQEGAERTRSYFVSGLLTDVVLKEAGLAGTDWAVVHRRRLRAWAAAAVSLVATLCLGSVLAFSWLGSQQALGGLEGDADLLNEASARRAQVLQDRTLISTLGALDRARAIVTQATERERSSFALGIYQGDAVVASASSLYGRMLDGLLLPAVVNRLAEQVRTGSSRADFLFPALKSYLMATNAGVYDGAFLTQWLTLDWNARNPAANQAALRDSFATHMRTLAAAGPRPGVRPDDALVEAARRALATTSMADRGYGLLKQLPEVTALPPWRVVDHAGPAAPRALRRLSGVQLWEGVPGLYTYDAFHAVVLPALPEVARLAAAEAWVVDDRRATDEARQADLIKAILALYLDDYGRAWDAILADVTVAPLDSIAQASDVLNALSGPTSPLKLYLEAVLRETTLEPGPKKDADPRGALAGAAATATGVSAAGVTSATGIATRLNQTSALARLFPTTGADAGPPPGQPINDRFRDLRAFVRGPEGGAAPLEEVIKEFGEVFKQVNQVAQSPDQGRAMLASLQRSTTSGTGPFTKLRQLSATMPGPVARSVSTLINSGQSVTGDQARDRLNTIWTASVVPACRALEARYPLVTEAQLDAPLEDFAQLFGPKGVLQDFFDKELKGFVDTEVSPWRWQRSGGTDLRLSADTLTMFETAAQIRQGLFGNAEKPTVRFDIEPVELDQRANQAQIEIDGAAILYRHEPPRPTAVKWPGEKGAVRITFQPAIANEPSSVSFEGPWAWFRLLRTATLTRQGDNYLAEFTVGSRKMTVRLRPSALGNPFDLSRLRGFRCRPTL
ncbi:MAG: type VI secretion system membrane subunit TssM [Alphaproteobacteria bacterium]|nr:type VI secretion system membrane subunit TssM [Alphaproteobacteria bacterium]